VLGAEFLDRGPELNSRQLQLRIGSGEIHTTHTPNSVPSGHFVLEIHDWEEMIANLDGLGVPYTPPSIRAYSGGHSTYIQDPDGNTIELVQHPRAPAAPAARPQPPVLDGAGLWPAGCRQRGPAAGRPQDRLGGCWWPPQPRGCIPDGTVAQ
jgi:hypothetical protein